MKVGPYVGTFSADYPTGIAYPTVKHYTPRLLRRWSNRWTTTRV
jgi:hypothetical protein